jgi:P27 family predicted phage terminase small subunit
MAYLPPSHLSPAAKKLWREVVPSEVKSSRVLAVLTAGLEAFDRAADARKAIKRDGMVSVSGTGIPHVHPLLKVERDSRQQFVAVWKSLGLDQEAHESTSGNEAMETALRSFNV